jgi:hypothetical protein
VATPVQYTYSIATDTLNGAVALDTLEAEIKTSSVVASIDYSFFRVDGGTLKVGLKDTIAGDQVALNAVVNSHAGVAIAEPPQVVTFPKVVDGAPVVAANTWPLEQSVVWCGQADDVGAGSIGGGAEFRVQLTAVGDTDITYQFVHPIRLGGGWLYWTEAEYGDYAEMQVIAPATAGTYNAGAGAYAKLAIGGGASVFVHPSTPGAGGADWDIDLSETLNANVDFTKAVPVPAPGGDGFFTYSSSTGVLTFTPGTGSHNLFDVAIPLSRFVRKLWLLGSGNQSLNVMDNVPAMVHPQWQCKVTGHRESGTGNTRSLVWTMLISRDTTT